MSFQCMDWEGQIELLSLSLWDAVSTLSLLCWEKNIYTGKLDLSYYTCARWAFIDLTAGPFSRGPAVGWEGVRTEYSLPNVTETNGAVTEISEDDAEDCLQGAIQEKFAIIGDRSTFMSFLLSNIAREGKLSLLSVKLDEGMRDLKNEVHSVEGEEYDENHKRKASEASTRMESWNFFSDTQEEFQNYTVARDTFLAHLGATLWGSMKQIVSPSVADGAFPYYEKISFQLFFITEEKVRHITQLLVDLGALMERLSSLLLPSQKINVYSAYVDTLTGSCTSNGLLSGTQSIGCPNFFSE